MSEAGKGEKRRILAFLALVVPLPLLFAIAANHLFVLAGLVAALVLNCVFYAGRTLLLPDAVLNLLGAAYVAGLVVLRPILAPSLTGAAVQLVFFLTLVRIASLRTEKEEWTSLVLLGMLAISSAATAVDMTIVVYLVVVLHLFLFAAARFVYLKELESVEGREAARDERVPARRFLMGVSAAAVVAALPIFVLLPRTRSPFLPGMKTDTQLSSAFSDSLDMSSIGDLKKGDRIVFRASFDPPESGRGDREEKFRGTVYSNYDEGRWTRGRLQLSPFTPDPADLLDGNPERTRNPGPVSRVDIDLVRTQTTVLFLPYDAVAVESSQRLPAMARDRTASLVLRFPLARPLSYSVLRRRAAVRSRPGEVPADSERTVPSSGFDRVRELAEKMAEGRTDPLLIAKSFESRLATGYEYTLNVPDATGAGDPIQHFLFETRRGHCELFASAMVLLLRARGIPARLVLGFSGGERSLFGREILVRQRHAHAWVEMWNETDGSWMVFDPTPFDGRPAIESVGVWGRVRQIWEGAQFFWDRYVLGYGFPDQWNLVVGLQNFFDEMTLRIPKIPDHLFGIRNAVRAVVLWLGRSPLASAGFALLSSACLALLWSLAKRRGARLRPGADHLNRAIVLLGASGELPVDVSRLTVWEASGRLREEAWARPFRRIAESYEREAFAGVELDSGEIETLSGALREMRAALRRLKVSKRFRSGDHV